MTVVRWRDNENMLGYERNERRGLRKLKIECFDKSDFRITGPANTTYSLGDQRGACDSLE